MNAWWRARPSKHDERTWPCLIGLITIPIVGVCNYYTGPEYSFLIFYLPSIALVGWLGGSFLGGIAGLEAAVASLIADLKNVGMFVDPMTPYWNSGLRAVAFIAFGLLFAILRQNRDYLQRRVADKTAALQKEITERARIQREVAEICAHQQRQIAYDLHDGVGQHLSGIAFKSKLLEQKLRKEGSVQADEAAAITALVNDALRQTRLIARSTESTYGEARGLKEALRKFGEELCLSGQVAANVIISDTTDNVGAPADAQLFRITQEAVRNAIAHGHAQQIDITLESNHNDTVLTVRDDGSGFDEAPPGEGMGMRTMNYRAQTLGGSVVVTSQRDAGTTVVCRVPKPKRDGSLTTKLE